VDVQVRHGLTSGGTVVDADVEAVGLELGRSCDLGLVEQRQERGALLTAQRCVRRAASRRDKAWASSEWWKT
jgi:hypothetical protein